MDREGCYTKRINLSSFMEERTQSRTLLTLVGIALLVIVGGTMWYMTSRGSDIDTMDGTTLRDAQGRTPVGQNENIVVYAPQQNERIGTPLVVAGEARVFENTVNFRLLDAQGEEIAEGFATADSREVGQFGAFRGELHFISETDQQGILEVYQISANDGTEIDKLTIPVVITTTPEFIKG